MTPLGFLWPAKSPGAGSVKFVKITFLLYQIFETFVEDISRLTFYYYFFFDEIISDTKLLVILRES